jgi:recombination protein RecT
MNADAKQVTVPEAIEAAKDRFMQIAPKGLDFTAEHGFAVQLLNNNDYLKKCAMSNPISLQAAIINVAAIGLSLNPAKKQAYLIPRNVKHGNEWVSKIFLEPSYVGLVDLATSSGSILWVQANTVHTSDQFIDNGPGQRPTHIYMPFDPPAKRGEMIGAYCVARTSTEDYLTCMMPMHEILSVRDRSESWKRNQSGPWATDFGEQVKKTVIRRAFKTWPKTPTLERMAAAIDLSNNNEGFEPILTSPALGQYTTEQKAYLDNMITNSDKIGMFVFAKTIEETTFTNLYHSFEKGSKGKYQRAIDDLLREGGAQIRDVIEAMDAHAADGDDMGVKSELDGLSNDARNYVLEHCSAQARQMAMVAA